MVQKPPQGLAGLATSHSKLDKPEFYVILYLQLNKLKALSRKDSPMSRQGELKVVLHGKFPL